MERSTVGGWLAALFVVGCNRAEAPPPQANEAAAPLSASSAAGTYVPVKVDVVGKAMGTQVTVVAFTTPTIDEARTRAAMDTAIKEIRRLEDLMTTWRPSEMSTVNQKAGEWVEVSPATFDVMERSVWAGKTSKGTFDVTFASMGELWKFGDVAEDSPKLPSASLIERRKKSIDYRKIELDAAKSRVKIAAGQRVDLGGIAKGYAVDAAARVMRSVGLTSFLVQAGGDLFGAGKKPDGSPWVSGIRDPRGPETSFFATIELTDRAFSTAGDYARSFVLDGKRYHHIIDPRTGWPATESRSVTIWAPDAFTADAIDDAVFILGPKEGLELVESLDGVGAVIVDEDNRVWVSKRLESKVKVLRQPTNAP